MNYESILNSEKYVVKVIEGLGDYKGTSIDSDYNPYGRMGARVEAYVDGILVYTTNNASTLPDSLDYIYAKKYNGGSPIPTIYEGIYSIYTKMHNNKYKAFELGKGYETTPVIRDGFISTSYSINMHYREFNDPTTYASSAGCITVLESDLMDMFEFMGITSFNGEYIGKIIITRESISDELFSIYSDIYGESVYYLFTKKEGFMDWKEILDGCLDAPQSSIKMVEAMESISNLACSVGDLEQAKYLSILIEKVFEFGKTQK